MYKINKITESLFSIHRISDGAFIPLDESNSDYQKYLVWAETNTPEVQEESPEDLERKVILQKVVDIENSISERRKLEAMLGDEKSIDFIKEAVAKIKELRKGLK